LLAHGWWFSPGTSASSTTKTGRQDINGFYQAIQLLKLLCASFSPVLYNHPIRMWDLGQHLERELVFWQIHQICLSETL
jgi:hypothetical protein